MTNELTTAQDDDLASPGPPEGVKECPFCAESIKARAKKCKHCGEFVEGHTSESVQREINIETDQGSTTLGSVVGGDVGQNVVGSDKIGQDKIEGNKTEVEAVGEGAQASEGSSVFQVAGDFTQGKSLCDEQYEHALNWDDKRRLRGFDLEGRDLKQVKLVGADLSLANLRGAKLRWADLSQADLSEADLTGAELTGVTLNKANLYKAHLAVQVSLYKAHLYGAIITDKTTIQDSWRFVWEIVNKVNPPAPMGAL